MDFEVQAAGTLPAAALTARGPDHNIEYPQADPFETVLGDATGSTAAAAANRRQSPYSSVSGVLSGFTYSRDPVLLASLLHGSVIAPAKLHAAFTYLTQNGIPPTQDMTQSEFLDAGETVVREHRERRGVTSASTA